MIRYIRFFDEIGAQDLLLVGGILSHGHTDHSATSTPVAAGDSVRM